ncbi:MAG: hypothetical protein M0006_17015 [Magnetospirillum sp.]|nr:hypothetical protein [Magnetospirillum sp.]
MRRCRAFLLALALLAAGPFNQARAEGFLSACEDLPLAPGLTEVPDSSLSFDTPSGRIVEAYAKGTVGERTMLAFYASTLPQLGWTRESDTRFRREAEVLRLDSSVEDRKLVVHFTISPE